MPTKTNVEKLDALQVALGQMVELKKAVDRIEGEIRTVQTRKEMLVGGPQEEEEAVEVKKEEGESRADRESSIRVSFSVDSDVRMGLMSLLLRRRSGQLRRRAGRTSGRGETERCLLCVLLCTRLWYHQVV